MSLPDYWVSIDPGDKYVGFATWHGSHCVSSIEIDPRRCVEVLEMLMGARTPSKPEGGQRIVDRVVCEKFALYPKACQEMVWNEFLTSQLIGVIKYLSDTWGVEYVAHPAFHKDAVYKSEWFRGLTMSDKRDLPWWGQLKNGDHCKDAWAHGLYHIDQLEKRINRRFSSSSGRSRRR